MGKKGRVLTGCVVALLVVVVVGAAAVVWIGMRIGEGLMNPIAVKEEEAEVGAAYAVSAVSCAWVALVGAAVTAEYPGAGTPAPGEAFLVLAVAGKGWNPAAISAVDLRTRWALDRALTPGGSATPAAADAAAGVAARRAEVALRVPAGTEEVEVGYKYETRDRSGRYRYHRLVWRVLRGGVADRPVPGPPPVVWCPTPTPSPTPGSSPTSDPSPTPRPNRTPAA